MLAANPANLASDIGAAARGGATLLHVDVMDGHFVPNLSFGPHISAGLAKVVDLPQDVHLMVERPTRFADPFIKAGASGINVHVETETTEILQRLLADIRGRKVRTAVTIKPGTLVDAIVPFLDLVDMILIMTVEPGYGGQSFLPGSTERIRLVKSMLSGRPVDIQVDGGITLENAPACIEAGANILVAGSAVFGAGDAARGAAQFAELFAEYAGGHPAARQDANAREWPRNTI